VSLTWVFFRAGTTGDALLIFGKLAALPAECAGYLSRLPQTGLIGAIREAFQLGSDVAHPIEWFGVTQMGLSFMYIAALVIGGTRTGTEARQPLALRWAGYYALVMVLLLGRPVDSVAFMYFTF
jgi:hypothetical protein